MKIKAAVTYETGAPFVIEEVELAAPKADEILAALDQKGILGGLPYEGGVLWCATEKVSKETLDEVVAIVKGVLA